MKICSLLIIYLLICNIFALSETEQYIEKQLELNRDLPTKIQSGTNFFAKKSLVIIGTETDDEDEIEFNQIIAEVVEFRIKKWLNKPNAIEKIIADSLLTAKQIKEYNLILVGTPVSNMLTAKISKYLPFKITEDDIVFKDNIFSGEEVGITLRFANPIEKENMVWIVTAPCYEALRFIPKESEYVIHELKDYNPQSDRFLELAQGNFDPNWQLDKITLTDNTPIDTGENDPIIVSKNEFYPAPEWTKSGVMYEIFVRSFYDSNGDGIGDLNGITEKLDYLNDGDPKTDDDLGVSVIWLMPIFDSPSYHGYDTRDYFKINPDYGTNADFQNLLQEAHKRGIRIVTDLALNHATSDHPFFKDAFNNPNSKYDKYFYFSNKSNTRAHNWYFRDDPKDRDMLKPYMPCWNVSNPEVQKYLFSVAKYWMDPNEDGDFSDGIDGFRLDYVKGPPHEFWKNFRQEIKAYNPDVLLLAEAWLGLDEIAKYFDNEFDMCFDFPFQGDVVGSVSSGSSRALNKLLTKQKEILPEHAIMNRFIDNHDMRRINSSMKQEDVRLCTSILLSLPGMPMLYYGTEIGMLGKKDPYDEGIRRPMEWYKKNSGKGLTNWYPIFNQKPDGISVEEQLNKKGSILEFTKSLIDLRNKHTALQSGNIEMLDVFKEEESYRRAFSYKISDENETIIIVANLHDELVLDIAIPDELENKQFSEIKENAKIKIKNNKLQINCKRKTLYILEVN